LAAEAVILGSGTSTGVPTLGFDYTEAFLANPKNHRTRPSLLLRGPEGDVVVDCGPDMRLQLLREGVRDVAAAIITHSHADHIMGMDDLRSFSLRTGRPMPVYAQAADHEVIRRVFAYAFEPFPPGVLVPRFELLEAPALLQLAGLAIETMIVLHGSMPVLALRVGDFAYVTDASHIPGAAWARLQGLETLVLDGLRYRPHPNHFTLAQAVEVASRLAARQTYFTHLAHDFDHDLTNATLPAGMALAYDGLSLPIRGC
jgi:phosphoribosyl 1,2-cyclic phosphate phosphodiesterase